MREIQATTVKTHLTQLLDDVEHGETIVITRHGRAIARIVPENVGRAEDVEQAIAGIRAIRKRTGRITVEELLTAREEGRRA